MAARSGMANLITRLRSMTEVGTADYTLAGATYWSDDQLQVILDSRRTELIREPIEAEYEFVGAGTPEYHNYFMAFRDLEEAASGTPIWEVEDSTGATVGTASYTVNYDAGHIRFTSDTDGEVYYLTARTFNLNAAAAEVWQKKASHVHKAYDFAADGARYDRSQMFVHCMKMAEHYRNFSGIKVSRLFRSDV